LKRWNRGRLERFYPGAGPPLSSIQTTSPDYQARSFTCKVCRSPSSNWSWWLGMDEQQKSMRVAALRTRRIIRSRGGHMAAAGTKGCASSVLLACHRGRWAWFSGTRDLGGEIPPCCSAALLLFCCSALTALVFYLLGRVSRPGRMVRTSPSVQCSAVAERKHKRYVPLSPPLPSSFSLPG
jgi:hypothetical protein